MTEMLDPGVDWKTEGPMLLERNRELAIRNEELQTLREDTMKLLRRGKMVTHALRIAIESLSEAVQALTREEIY
jgi:hypothetical protein